MHEELKSMYYILGNAGVGNNLCGAGAAYDILLLPMEKRIRLNG